MQMNCNADLHGQLLKLEICKGTCILGTNLRYDPYISFVHIVTNGTMEYMNMSSGEERGEKKTVRG